MKAVIEEETELRELKGFNGLDATSGTFALMMHLLK